MWSKHRSRICVCHKQHNCTCNKDVLQQEMQCTSKTSFWYFYQPIGPTDRSTCIQFHTVMQQPKFAQNLTSGILCGDTDSLRNLIRGAKAIRGANYRVKLLQEQAAMKVAKLEQLKLVSLNDRANCSSHQSKGMTLMKRGLLMRKHLEVKNTAENMPSVNNNPSISSRSESIIDLENKPPEITSISEAVRSIKELSIQQILKRHDKPNWQTGR